MAGHARTAVGSFGSRVEAEVAAAMLRAHGIEAHILADDAGGLRPDLGATGGLRVMVPAADAPRAIALLGTPPTDAESAEADRLAEVAATAADRDEGREARRGLYPEIEPYDVGQLAVDGLHTLYYEQCGNPRGKPVVFVHGGPGGGCDAKQRRFFDPAAYRIVLFDQRGCGRSTPHAELRDNTTWHLVADLEALRGHLGIDRWQVFGGSWGSTLALAYAQAHPTAVTELVLRGIFLLRPSEIAWFYQDGASRLFPDAWEHFLAPVAKGDRGDMVAAYHALLTGDDVDRRLAAARAWSIWEGRTSYFQPTQASQDRFAQATFALAFARIECHYFRHHGFLKHPNQLLDDVARMRHLPGVIVQGRYDVVCPLQSAWDLHRAWPEAEMNIVPDAGHSAWEPGTVDALVRATDRFRPVVPD